MRNPMIHRTGAERRILVVAGEAVGGAALRDLFLGADGEPGAEVLLPFP
jgi:hypothetical protein